MKNKTVAQLSSSSLMQMTVADLLAIYPEAIPIFLNKKMSCVGCSMASFETLSDAARIYNLSAEQFRQEIITIITQSSQDNTSV